MDCGITFIGVKVSWMDGNKRAHVHGFSKRVGEGAVFHMARMRRASYFIFLLAAMSLLPVLNQGD